MLAIASSLSARYPRELRVDEQAAQCLRASENGVFGGGRSRRRGFTGGDNGLDGRWGFFQVLGDGADLDRLIGVRSDSRGRSSIRACRSKPLSVRLAEPSEHGRHDESREGSRPEAGSDRGRAGCARGNNILEPLRCAIAKNELEAKFSVPFLMSAVTLTRRARYARVHRRIRARVPPRSR